MLNKSSSKANQTKTNRIAFLFGAGADPICYYGDAFTKEFLYKQRLSIRNMIIEQLQVTPEFQNQMLNDEYVSFIGEYRKQTFSSFENQVMCRTLKQIIEDRDIADVYEHIPNSEINDPVLLEFLRIAKYVYTGNDIIRP